MVQQECLQYEKNGMIYAYGKSFPACPDCGEKMKVHGTCRRNVRTATYPEGKLHALRVLICNSCKKTHRDLPNFIVPYKGYSFDYMYAVAAKKEEPNDNRKKHKIITLFCSIIVLLWPCFCNLECSCSITETEFFQSIYKFMNKFSMDFFRSKNRNSTDLQFTKERKRVILSAIQEKGVASDGKCSRSGKIHAFCSAQCVCK